MVISRQVDKGMEALSTYYLVEVLHQKSSGKGKQLITFPLQAGIRTELRDLLIWILKSPLHIVLVIS